MLNSFNHNLKEFLSNEHAPSGLICPSSSFFMRSFGRLPQMLKSANLEIEINLQRLVTLPDSELGVIVQQTYDKLGQAEMELIHNRAKVFEFHVFFC